MAKGRRSTYARGYDRKHQDLRDQWAPKVRAGLVDCWRCGGRIQPGRPWDLGHDDEDRSKYRGPEHRSCNRRAGGANGAKVTNASRGRAVRTSRQW